MKTTKKYDKKLAKYKHRSRVLMGELFYKQTIKLLKSKQTDALIFSNKDIVTTGVMRRFWLIMPNGVYKLTCINNEVKLLVLYNNKFYNLRTFKKSK